MTLSNLEGHSFTYYKPLQRRLNLCIAAVHSADHVIASYDIVCSLGKISVIFNILKNILL